MHTPRYATFSICPLFQLFPAIFLAVPIVPKLAFSVTLNREYFRSIDPKVRSRNSGNKSSRLSRIRSEDSCIVAALFPGLYSPVQNPDVCFAVVEESPPDASCVELVIVHDYFRILIDSETLREFCEAGGIYKIASDPSLRFRRSLVGRAIDLAGSRDVSEAVLNIVFRSKDHQFWVLRIY